MQDHIVSTEYDGKRRRLYPYQCEGCGGVAYAPKCHGRKFCKKECHKPKEVDVVCDFCHKPFKRKKSLLKKSKSGFRFCDRACKDKGQTIGSNLQKMRPRHYADGRSSYRDIAKRGLPIECNRCGWKEVPGVLKVHHRDRNRDNNKIENLEILCPNCHDIEHFVARDGIYNWLRRPIDNGLVAQLGERRTCNAEAAGS